MMDIKRQKIDGTVQLVFVAKRVLRQCYALNCFERLTLGEDSMDSTKGFPQRFFSALSTRVDGGTTPPPRRQRMYLYTFAPPRYFLFELQIETTIHITSHHDYQSSGRQSDAA